MKISQEGLKLIRDFEGLRLKPYKCPAGIPTIGIGSTRYENGKKVEMTDAAITEARAVELLKNTLVGFEHTVNKFVAVDINQNQFDALVSFTYNVGSKSLLTSTLLRKLNAMDWLGASQEFGKWVYADRKKLNGLVERRKAEKELFASM